MDNEKYSALIAKVIEGDKAARDDLIERLVPWVRTLVDRHLTRNPKHLFLEDDLFSAGCVALVEGVDSLTASVEDPRKWVKTQILNAFNDLIHLEVTIQIPNRSRKRNSIPVPQQEIGFNLHSVASQHGQLAAECLEEILAGCVTPLERQVIQMRAQGMRYIEIADRVNRSPSWISNAILEIFIRYQQRLTNDKSH